MIEVRFHGRGGQGAVMASKILATAFVKIKKYGASFPMFGFERRGAPVTAFGRFSKEPIREKTQIYNPDILMVLDPSQKNSSAVFQGLVSGGIMIINYDNDPNDISHENLETIGSIDANTISIEEIGMAMPNTCLLGAFAKVTGTIDLKPVIESFKDYFQGEKLEANARCAKRGFDEVKILIKN
ncbi:MAG: ketoisovalerate oxidoreductase [Desulfobacteraceae bacterium 4572_130]|nr:MAG: ketoisovalerate oxidoreductase [Desulfobacteraceae bacterium 4572_130]